MSKLEIQVVKEKRWFIRLVSLANGKTLMVSETYVTRWGARRAGTKLAKINGFGYREMSR